MIVPCPNCGKERNLGRKTKAICRECVAARARAKINVRNIPHRVHLDKHGKKASQYLRVCECGNESWVWYLPKLGQQCKPCSDGETKSDKIVKKRKKKAIHPKESIKREVLRNREHREWMKLKKEETIFVDIDAINNKLIDKFLAENEVTQCRDIGSFQTLDGQTSLYRKGR